MAVPAHDTRDYEFAKKFGIEIIQVLEGGDISQEAWTEDGNHINSGFLNGLNKEDAINTMIAYLKEHKIGKKHKRQPKEEIEEIFEGMIECEKVDK